MSEEKKDGRAYFDVSFQLLEEMLHLPEGTRIRYVEGDYNRAWGTRTFRVFVTSPELPEVPDSNLAPGRDPAYRTGQTETPIFVDWGHRTF